MRKAGVSSEVGRATFTVTRDRSSRAVYYARSLGFRPEDGPIEVPIITEGDRWNVRVTARVGARIKVPAGHFDTFKLTLDPTPAPGAEIKEEFEGLFGLKVAIHIWIDKVRKCPVLVQGKLPFGIVDLFVRAELELISHYGARRSSSSGSASWPKTSINRWLNGQDTGACTTSRTE